MPTAFFSGWRAGRRPGAALPLLLLLWAGCGGGDAAPDPVRAGRFLDGPVAGLFWETPTETGLTDPAGGFRYRPGERIDFWVGDVWLGRAPAAPVLTPVDLVPGAGGPDHPMVVNLARFLQTLDADGAPDNGLRIPAAARAAAAGRDIDFSRSADRFAADPDWQALLAAAGAAGAFPEGAARETVPAAAAAAHLSRTLAALADNPEDPNGDGGGSGGSGADAGGG